MTQICRVGFFRKKQRWDNYLNILKSPQWVYGREMAQIWQSIADDMGKEICYTDIVYKWVQEDPLVFLFKKI